MLLLLLLLLSLLLLLLKAKKSITILVGPVVLELSYNVHNMQNIILIHYALFQKELIILR